MNTLSGKDILRADQFTKPEIEQVLEVASEYERALTAGEALAALRGRVLAALFFEPSTRTRLSFETAMLRLGGQVISVAEAKSSSAAKGESLVDTIRTVDGYADVIVLRHPQIGTAEEAAQAARAPVLNAGDGAGQHPTQSLLDLFTIRREQGRIDGLKVAMVGDLKNGRTVHSLAALLSNYGVSLLFVAPPALRMPTAILERLREKGVPVAETGDLAEAVRTSDILYMTRIQRERFEDPAEYERLKGAYVLDRAALRAAKPSITILHPLPRVQEIALDVDDHPGAAYFRQSANGVPIRMALLSLVLG